MMIRGAVGVEERHRAVRERDACGHHLHRAAAVRTDLDVREIAHVERMVGIRIHVAGRSRVEVTARRGEVGRAFADGMEMDAVHAGLEAGHNHGDVDNPAGALRTLGEFRSAGDPFTLDIGVGAEGPRVRGWLGGVRFRTLLLRDDAGRRERDGSGYHDSMLHRSSCAT